MHVLAVDTSQQGVAIPSRGEFIHCKFLHEKMEKGTQFACTNITTKFLYRTVSEGHKDPVLWNTSDMKH
jgi:hypothetical protein